MITRISNLGGIFKGREDILGTQSTTVPRVSLERTGVKESGHHGIGETLEMDQTISPLSENMIQVYFQGLCGLTSSGRVEEHTKAKGIHAHRIHRSGCTSVISPFSLWRQENLSQRGILSRLWTRVS